MEPNGLHGGLFSGTASGTLGLEMPLHPQSQQPPQQQQQKQNPHQQYPQMVAFTHPHHDTNLHHSQAQQPMKQHGYLFSPKLKQQQLSPLSDDDEIGLTPDDGAGDGRKKSSSSPWQRMKWTDSMVKLLVLAVLYIGDEVGSEGNDKKKAGALLQKKGKWKSVSRAMMERGFYVSPQQCEDKFNDLNKRYKRVNEILGKGTACRVVENQSLLETMDLAPKMKEEVKKLLNSKHLFFKEMCAYHNTCGHVGGTSGTSGVNLSPEIATEPVQPQVQHQQGQHRCLHSSENSQPGANSNRAEIEGSKLVKVGSGEEDGVEEDESDEDDYDDYDDEGLGNSRGQQSRPEDENNNNDEKPSRKRPRQYSFPVLPVSPLILQLRCEVSNVIQDGAKTAWEKKQWMMTRLLQLEEQQVSYQNQAFEIEKQRLKWVKFSSKKEREMERAKLENERRRLENERMLLVLRQKEHELIDLQHHNQQQHSSTKMSDPSSITG